MKRINFIKQSAAAFMIAAISFAGCNGGSKNTMILTTAIRGEVTLELSGTGTAVIDWGDGGRPERVTLSPPIEHVQWTGTSPDTLYTHERYEHTFSGTTNRDIVIKGEITYLDCTGLGLTALDVSKNVALTELSCGFNQLTALDVSKNTALTKLYCGAAGYGHTFINRLTSLDVSKNTALTDLGCDYNKLTSLDVSKNKALTYLGCSYNQLTAIDITQNTALTSLHLEENKFTKEEVETLIGMLHSNAGLKFIFVSVEYERGALDRALVAIARAKGWRVNNE